MHELMVGEVSSIPSAPAYPVVTTPVFSGMLKPLASLEEEIALQRDVRQRIRDGLTLGRDYGMIPGTKKRDKLDANGNKIAISRGKFEQEEVRSLYKAGAEKINKWFGLYPVYELIEKTVDHNVSLVWTKTQTIWEGPDHARTSRKQVTQGEAVGLYRYVVVCKLVHRASGAVVGMHPGICSSLESKYCDRPREIENTVVKMACKRAYVGVTLNVHALSDEFSQDMEDDPDVEDEIKERNLKESEKEERKANGGVRVIATLAEALEFPFPGKKEPKNPHGGALLKAVPASVIRNGMAYFVEKYPDPNDMTTEQRQFIMAGALVLKDREDRHAAQQAELLAQAEAAKANATTAVVEQVIAEVEAKDDLPF